MNAEERGLAAVEYKHNGCNCCQAVLMSYTDSLNADKEVLMNIGSGFGMGMGCMEGTCGALCGAVIATGLIKNGERTTISAKEILKNFKEKSGATICKELKGIETGKILCSCDDCVKNAAMIVSEILNLETV